MVLPYPIDVLYIFVKPFPSILIRMVKKPTFIFDGTFFFTCFNFVFLNYGIDLFSNDNPANMHNALIWLVSD